MNVCPGSACTLRWVSVIAPCRNEVAYIDAFCDSVLSQKLPEGWRLEVLVADGGSDDGTRRRLAQRVAADTRLVAVDNPGCIVSTGLNVCLEQARGDVIVRMDIHTYFAPDYVAECIDALQRTQADNVGGAWVAEGVGPTGRAIAAAFQSRWVVGGARSRDMAYEGEVDTVYLGCWPRQTLARIGGFDETLVRNQDDEHNLRLRLAGGRIWQSARIRSWYRPRDRLAYLFRQQYQYGYWRPFVMRKHGRPGSVRQLVPAAFVAALCGGALIAVRWPTPLLGVLMAYAVYLSAVSLVIATGQSRDAVAPRFSATRLRLIASMFAHLLLVIPAYHLGYGLGGWRGLMDLALRRRMPDHVAKITR